MLNRTVLERVYFHIGNSGLVLKVTHDTPDEGSSYVGSIYHLEASMKAFGVPLGVSIPLGSPEIVYWLHEVTGRILKKMVCLPNCGRHTHFGEHDPDHGRRVHPGQVAIEDGNELEYNFTYDALGVHFISDTPEAEEVTKEQAIQSAKDAEERWKSHQAEKSVG
jgi:hypothetical protein